MNRSLELAAPKLYGGDFVGGFCDAGIFKFLRRIEEKLEKKTVFLRSNFIVKKNCS